MKSDIEPHVTIYSGHDSTIYALMHALNNEIGQNVWSESAEASNASRLLTDVIKFDHEVPPYASTVTVATWQDLDFNENESQSKGNSTNESIPLPQQNNEQYAVEITFNGQHAFVPMSVFESVTAHARV